MFLETTQNCSNLTTLLNLQKHSTGIHCFNEVTQHLTGTCIHVHFIRQLQSCSDGMCSLKTGQQWTCTLEGLYLVMLTTIFHNVSTIKLPYLTTIQMKTGNTLLHTDRHWGIAIIIQVFPQHPDLKFNYAGHATYL